MRTGELNTLADGLHFPEGLRWHDDRLWVSDFYDHLVLAYDVDGSRTVVCEVPGQPSGLGFTPEGDLLISSMKDRCVLRLRDGELTEVANLRTHAPGFCNDMHVDASGRAYVGNFGSDLEVEGLRPTVLLRVDPDGRVAVAAEDLVFPNGMASTSDGRLLVAETFAGRITAFDVGAGGELSNRQTWAAFGEAELAPDGICLDATGALWVADATGTGAVRVVEGGEIVERVELDGLTAFACTLGGSDGRTLYLAAGPPLGEIDPAAERRGSIVYTCVEAPGLSWA